MKVVRILDKGECIMECLKIEDKLELIKSKVDNLEGIHCVIGDSYCNHKEPGYIDEFYICPNENNNIHGYIHDNSTFIFLYSRYL